MRKFIYLAIFLSQSLWADKNVNVLIRPLSNTGSSAYDWFAAGFYHSISYNLGIVKNLRIQSIKELGEAYHIEYELNKKNAAQFPKKLDVDLIVSGTYSINEKEIKLSIKLKSKGETKNSSSFVVTGNVDELINLESQFIQSFIEEANNIIPVDLEKIEITGIQLKKIALNRIPFKYFQSYSKGLSLQLKNRKDATKYFLEAIKEPSEFPAVYIAIGEYTNTKLNQPALSIAYFNKAIDIQKKRKEEDTPNYLTSLSQLSFAYYKKGDYKNALGYYILTRNAFQKQNITGIGFAFILNHLGVLYLDAGNYDNAIESFLLAKRLYETIDIMDSIYYAELLSNIGVFYFESQQGTAIAHLEEAKQTFEKGGFTDNYEYANCLSFMGNFYLLENDLKNAMDYFLKSMEINRKIGNTKTFTYASLNNNIGLIYLRKGDLNKAKETFEKSKSQLENLKLEESWTYTSTLINLGNTYYLLNEKEQYKKNLRLEWKMQKQLINAQTKYVEQ